METLPINFLTQLKKLCFYNTINIRHIVGNNNNSYTELNWFANRLHFS